jgi:hypothetical protein
LRKAAGCEQERHREGEHFFHERKRFQYILQEDAINIQRFWR